MTIDCVGNMQETKVSLTAKIAAELNQRWLAAAVKFSVIAIAVIALYQQDLTMVFTGALTNEATYHILAIPFLFGYLIYRKRKMVYASLQTSQIGASGFQKYLSILGRHIVMRCRYICVLVWKLQFHAN